MGACIKLLLANVIDYAGTFPPARLPLEAAIENYLGYKRSPYWWMLGRFVCAAASLQELQASPHWPALRDYPVALVGPPNPESDDYLQRLSAELESVKNFISPGGEATRGNPGISFECKFHRSPLKRFPAPNIFNILDAAKEWCSELFVEVPIQSGFDVWPLAPLIGVSGGDWGLKFRVGGVADDVPAIKHLAYAIRLCTQYDIRWKATAGLHQPLRHYDEPLGTLAHGFLNLLCAAVLTHAHRLGEPEIADVLKEEAFEAFAFTDQGVRWRDIEATVPQIREARKASMVSFGSCSFDEPVEGLRELQLIE
jgi:hypothetical protein